MNKAMIESYLRNLVGALLGAVTIVMGSTGISSPLDFGGAEWLLVANALWASAVPTLLRWVNKKDPAFGMIAAATASAVTQKLEDAAKAAKPAAAKKGSAGTGKVESKKLEPRDGDGDGMVFDGTSKERPATKKPAAKKPASKPAND